ncbi:MAG: diacylglycerol/lipid kinase family protein [Bryobacteraceae bacterium]
MIVVIPVYRRAVLIYNPRAGKVQAAGDTFVPGILEALTRAGHAAKAVATEGPGTAGSIAQRALGEGADLILACGGDGTLNEVAEGMVGSRIPVGMLPGGTANVLCCELGLRAGIEEAVALTGESQPTRIAVGRASTAGAAPRHFLLMAGAGLDAQIIYHMQGGLKQRWGKLAYWAAGFRQLTRSLAEFDVEIDGHKARCSFALASRVRNYGGDLEIASGASLLEDRFEIVLFEGKWTPRYLKYLAGIASGRLSGMSGVTVLQATAARFDAADGSPVYLQVDGELAGRLPATVEIVSDALTLLVPPSHER